MPIIGLISDTHGLVRPEALAALAGCELILHAGDVGKPAVLEELARIAPVRAVRGNVDRDDWAQSLPDSDVVEVGGHLIYVLHNAHELDLDPEAAGFEVVVCGHSHQPQVEQRGAVLYANPGSAGPRRFRLPVAVARLQWSTGGWRCEIVELSV